MITLILFLLYVFGPAGGKSRSSILASTLLLVAFMDCLTILIAQYIARTF